MTITNRSSGTNVHEIADGIYRMNTPHGYRGRVLVQSIPDRRRRAALVSYGMKKLFPLVREGDCEGRLTFNSPVSREKATDIAVFLYFAHA